MSRSQLVTRVLEAGWTYQQAADGSGVSRRTVAKWVRRFRADGVRGLEDGLSRPRRTPHITPARHVTRIQRLRQRHGLPAWAISRAVGVPRSTVSAWLRRLGLNQRPAAPPVPVQRYEWPAAGDLLHVDIKPLGRLRQPGHRVHGDRRRASPQAGWEYVHVAVDESQSPGVRRGPARSARDDLRGLPAASSGMVCDASGRGTPRHER